MICASPDLLAKVGVPNTPADLADRPCIIDTNYRYKQNWAFGGQGERQMVTVKGPVEVNSAEAVCEAALQGLGFIRMPLFFVSEYINEGRLKIVLAEHEEPMRGIYAVYPHRRHLTVKVRALVDFLVSWYAARSKAGART